MSKQTEFVPDVLLTREHPLGSHITVFLNGEKVERCLEARIHWTSLLEPTFGEVIYTDKDRRANYALPQLGEFNYDNSGCWARLACGQVKVELDDAGQRMLRVWQSYQSQ